MRIVRSKRRGLKAGIVAACLLALSGLYCAAMLLLPVPQPVLTASLQSKTLDTGVPADLPWPGSGQAAVGAVGYGVLATNGPDNPLPTASIAKVVLALSVLKQKPLNVGEQGPTITLTDKDVAIYQSYLASDGSVARVTAGEQITEYQALQAVLLPSANNMATSLANWAFGSEASYAAYANSMLAELGLAKTHIADASGFSPSTVSTPRELVTIGLQALKNPVIAQVVAQTEATLPVVGTVHNINTDLGQVHINGIKTGNTSQAGGCLLFSATDTVASTPITVVGVVMNVPGLPAALKAAPDLATMALANFSRTVALKKDQTVAAVGVPWAAPIPVKATDSLEQIAWKGTPLRLDINLKSGTHGAVGQASLGNQKANLVLQSNVPAPSAQWRLTHPLDIIRAAMHVQ